jgi:hypothetical protein
VYRCTCNVTWRRPRPTMPRFGLSVAATVHVGGRSIQMRRRHQSTIDCLANASGRVEFSPLIVFHSWSWNCSAFKQDIKIGLSDKMTIFEYHSSMETGMKKITCSGTPREVRKDNFWPKSQTKTSPLTLSSRSASSTAPKPNCRYPDASTSTPTYSKNQPKRTGTKCES